MELASAIERNRTQLLRILGTLFAIAGLADGGSVERIAAPVCRAVLRILRPAESAARRLIVAAERGLALPPPQPRPPSARPSPRASRAAHVAKPRAPLFRLFDPRLHVGAMTGIRRLRITLTKRPEPRIHVIDTRFDPRVPLFLRASAVISPPTPVQAAEATPDNSVSAVRLCRRLAALRSALEDVPRQARRYARWLARPQHARRPRLQGALRPGRPPGYRKLPLHKVDEILAECDWLARAASWPDTS